MTDHQAPLWHQREEAHEALVARAEKAEAGRDTWLRAYDDLLPKAMDATCERDAALARVAALTEALRAVDADLAGVGRSAYWCDDELVVHARQIIARGLAGAELPTPTEDAQVAR